MELLKQLVGISSVSGDEGRMVDFLQDYFLEKPDLKNKVKLFSGPKLQDNLIVQVGEKPTIAIFVHTDTIGFTVGYNNKLIPIGSPADKTGDRLVGKDKKGSVCCEIKKDDKSNRSIEFFRKIQPGTQLTYYPKYEQSEEYLEAPYLDNRVGIYTALKLAELSNNFVIAFTTYEEHGFGGAEICGKFIYERFGIQNALILDSTWVTEDVHHGKGPAVSIRDKGIPRRRYLNRILDILEESDLNRQIEVEEAGGSDGMALQKTAFPINWCFIGPPIKNPHSAEERIYKTDIDDTIELYRFLIQNLSY
jgi:putative aminopeptidase FrvX